MTAHLLVMVVAVWAVVQVTTGRFLPRGAEQEPGHGTDRRAAWRAWLEPRTLMIGGMVFALAVTEGTANDWLAVALIDGYGVERWVGVVGFGLFVTSMTVGRIWGTVLLDRYGRVAVLWSTMVAAGVGVLLIVFGQTPALVIIGIVLWGLGASLGFPVGMSAAADEEEHAPARVSVVSTVGVHRVPGRPAAAGLPRRPGRHPATPCSRSPYS